MSRGLFVSRATAVDVPALAAIAAVCSTHPWSSQQIRDEVSRGGGDGVLVAWGPSGASAAICASCSYRVAMDEMEILDLAVLPGWRRQGVARLLVLLALRRGERRGARSAHLEVRAGNQPAIRLYGSLGFEAVGVRRGYYSSPVEDALLMRRRLDAGAPPLG